jgi:hypothetical protein
VGEPRLDEQRPRARAVRAVVGVEDPHASPERARQRVEPRGGEGGIRAREHDVRDVGVVLGRLEEDRVVPEEDVLGTRRRREPATRGLARCDPRGRVAGEELRVLLVRPTGLRDDECREPEVRDPTSVAARERHDREAEQEHEERQREDQVSRLR